LDTKSVDAYSHFDTVADSYGHQYMAEDINKYEPNQFRLEIFLGKLKQIKPKSLLDVGCGSGEPLLAFLEAGIDAVAFDYAASMVTATKKSLTSKGYSADLVWRDDMENISTIKKGQHDCIVALGSIYYARNFEKAFESIVDLLPPGGHFIFSLRNELFSMFSMNNYTCDFYDNVLLKELEVFKSLNGSVKQYIKDRMNLNSSDAIEKNIDQLSVHSFMHNPLTIQADLLSPNDLDLSGIDFYHYHAAPPCFESTDTKAYRKASCKLELTQDWRGYFMASCFIVHAVKR
jgi:SAM-dependent methyltransferase